jgi:DNA-binding MarR family transcriptional regulator
MVLSALRRVDQRLSHHTAGREWPAHGFTEATVTHSAIGTATGRRPDSSDALRVMDGLRRIVRELRAAAGTIESDLGVSSAQLFVLRQLQAHPGLSMTEIAARTRTSQSAVSEVVGRLVRRGLVERQQSPADRRRAELCLSADGRAVVATAPETIQERLLTGLDALDAHERHSLADAMDAWLRAAGLADVRPTMFFEP